MNIKSKFYSKVICHVPSNFLLLLRSFLVPGLQQKFFPKTLHPHLLRLYGHHLETIFFFKGNVWGGTTKTALKMRCLC